MLRTRRRICGQLPGWALSADAFVHCEKHPRSTSADTDEEQTAAFIRRSLALDPEGEADDDIENLPGVDYAAIDAVLARSEAAIENATQPVRAGARE